MSLPLLPIRVLGERRVGKWSTEWIPILFSYDSTAGVSPMPDPIIHDVCYHIGPNFPSSVGNRAGIGLQTKKRVKQINKENRDGRPRENTNPQGFPQTSSPGSFVPEHRPGFHGRAQYQSDKGYLFL